MLRPSSEAYDYICRYPFDHWTIKYTVNRTSNTVSCLVFLRCTFSGGFFVVRYNITKSGDKRSLTPVSSILDTATTVLSTCQCCCQPEILMFFFSGQCLTRKFQRFTDVCVVEATYSVWSLYHYLVLLYPFTLGLINATQYVSSIL